MQFAAVFGLRFRTKNWSLDPQKRKTVLFVYIHKKKKLDFCKTTILIVEIKWNSQSLVFRKTANFIDCKNSAHKS